MNVDVLRLRVRKYFCDVYVKNSWKTNVFAFAHVFKIIFVGGGVVLHILKMIERK